MLHTAQELFGFLSPALLKTVAHKLRLLPIGDLGEPWGDSETCTGCGKCVQVCPTGALFTKGRTVAEMRKDRGFLKYIVTAREKELWIG